MYKKINYNAFVLCVGVLAFVLLIAIGVYGNIRTVFADEDVLIEKFNGRYAEGASTEENGFYTYVNDFVKATGTECSTDNELKGFGTFQNGCVQQVSKGMTATVDVYGDDNIVRFVPRNLFEKENDSLYIGNDYGYFISTRHLNGTANSISTVILIGVEVKSSASGNTVVDCEIKPLAQIDYHFVKADGENIVAIKAKDASGSYSNNGYQFFSLKSGLTSAVVPSVRVYRTGSACYKKYIASDDFLISDISLGMNIISEDTENTAGNKFDVNDSGFFISGNEYRYSATVRENNDKVAYGTGVKEIAKDKFHAVLGRNPSYGSVIETSDKVIRVADEFQKVYSDFTYDSKTACYRSTSLADYNTATAQKESFGMLIKSSAFTVNSNDCVFFADGDYARGIFNIGYAADNDGSIKYSRAEIDVSMKIARKTSEVVSRYEVRDCGSGKIKCQLGTPSTKTVEVFRENNCSIIGGGYCTFAVTPEYSGTYDLGFDADRVEIYSAGTVEISDNRYTAEIKAGSTFRFTVKNPQSNPLICTFKVDVSSIDENVRISNELLPYKGKYIAKVVCDSNGIYSLNGKENLLVEKVCRLAADGNFNAVFETYDYKAAHEIEMFMRSDEEYYVFLQKDNDTFEDADLSVGRRNIEWLPGKNSAFALSGGDNFRYAQFTASADSVQDYVFLFEDSNVNKSLYSYRVLDENGNLMTWDGQSNGYLKVFSMQPDKTYYIGVKCLSDVNTSPDISVVSPKFVWKVYEGDKLIKDDSAQLVRLERNKTYRVELWLDNNTKVKGIDYIDDIFDGRGLNIDKSSGEIAIELDRLADTSFSVIGKKDNGSIYSSILTINTMFSGSEFTLNDTVDYDNKIAVSWNCSSEYESLKYRVSGVTYDGKKFGDTFEVGSDVGVCDLLPYLIEKGAVSDVTFEVVSITIESGTPHAFGEQPIGKSLSINCMYSDTAASGRTEHLISNELQLFNIRYDQTFDRCLANDIRLSRAWQPIPELSCKLAGSNFKITNFKYHIGSGVPYPYNVGLVGINKGIISDLTLENVFISGAEGQHIPQWYFIGAIAGVNENRISNCKVTGNLTVHRQYSALGGIAGRNNGTIENSCFGSPESARSALYNNGDIGGIVGQSTGTVVGCVVENTDIRHYVVGNSCSAGGIVGYCSGGQIVSSAVHNVYITNANPNAVTNANSAPKMGMIVGHIENGTISSVGMLDTAFGYGGLTANTRKYCFNGDWPFYGYMTNTKVDEHINQNGP